MLKGVADERELLLQVMKMRKQNCLGHWMERECMLTEIILNVRKRRGR